MKDTDRYIIEEKERALKEQLEVSMDESNGWIYKTAEELNEELMVGMSKATIGKYINQLVEAGYLDKRNNPKYKWDKTLQYRVDLVKVQKDLAKLGYALEWYKLLPNIEIIDVDVEVKENKKASSTAIDEAPNNIKSSTSINNSYNKSIPQKDKKDTKKNKTLKNKFNDGTNNHFENYEPKELENLLNENQKGKFKDLEETTIKFKANYMSTMNKS